VHLWRIVVIFPFLLAAAHAQQASAPENFRVRHLILISSELSDAEMHRIVRKLEGIETDPNAEELAERVRQQLRDAGYYWQQTHWGGQRMLHRR
jgi:DNA polymerase IIIc chi subunit